MSDKIKESKINEIFAALHKYTQNHFTYEERYMEKMAYPDLEGHKNIHKNFIMRMMKIQKGAIKMRQEKNTMLKETAVFLKDWFLNHILIEDKKYVEFLKASGKTDLLK